SPAGEVVVPGELLYRKPMLVIRGTFKPVTCVNIDMMLGGQKQFSQESAVDESEILSLAEITMNSLVSGDNIDGADFLARIDLLASQGYTVMISDYVRFFRLRAYLRRYTQKPIGIVLSVRDLEVLFDEKYYEGLEGGILEAFGKLFPDNTHVYVYPSRRHGAAEMVTLDNVPVPAHLRHLLTHLTENGKLVAIEPQDAGHLEIDSAETLAGLRRGHGPWENDVPAGVAQRIIERRLLGFDSE
ncbi:MAG: nicotinate-nucleotide adenylyltransferase, partial [Betaproteobacteria bacterium HGW-Betaproteobacteria-21]